jgi:hypothetical protein
MADDFYIIDDRNWQEVLSLVPLAVWSEPPSRQPLCLDHITAAGWGAHDLNIRGPGQPLSAAQDSIRWQSENDAGPVDFVTGDRLIPLGRLRGARYQRLRKVRQPVPLALCFVGPMEIPRRHLWLKLQQGSPHQIALPFIRLKAGHKMTLYVATDGSTYRDARLRKLAQAGPARAVHKAPVLVYHREEQASDIEAPRQFLRTYLARFPATHVTHIGQAPEALRDGFFLPPGAREINAVLEIQQQVLEENAGDGNLMIVIAAADDYAVGLIAAVFAALRHALLFFIDQKNIGRYQRMAALIQDKQVVCVGGVADEVKALLGIEQATCYSDAELRQLYLKETLTQKLILVNPADNFSQFVVTEENAVVGINLHAFFGSLSLIAPFLAAAKHELILPVFSTNPHTIDQDIEAFVRKMETDWKVQAHYLTIFASPEAIPMAMSLGWHTFPYGDIWVELDSRYYGSLGANADEVDLAVGRICGITTSDCSAYVARVLFYDVLRRPAAPTDRSALFILAHDVVIKEDMAPQAVAPIMFTTLTKADELRARLFDRHLQSDVAACFDRRDIYLSEKYLPEQPTRRRKSRSADAAQNLVELRRKFQTADLILYIGDAYYNGYQSMDTPWFYSEQVQLNWPIIVGVGCLTGAYDWVRREQHMQLSAQKLAAGWLDEVRAKAALAGAPLPYVLDAEQHSPETFKLTDLFALQALRRGALGIQCAVDFAYFHEESDDLLRALYVEGLSLGEAFRRAKNAEYLRLPPAKSQVVNATDGKLRGDAQYILIGDPTFVV